MKTHPITFILDYYRYIHHLTDTVTQARAFGYHMRMKRSITATVWEFRNLTIPGAKYLYPNRIK